MRRVPRPSFATAGGALIMALAALLPAASEGSGQMLMTQEEALAAAFPAPSAVQRVTAFLSDAQLARARALAGKASPIDQGIVTHYVARRNGRPLGVAYFDAHRVRTKSEVVMIVVTPDGRVDRVDVLQFLEPPEYRAPAGWLDLFGDRALDADLSMRGSIMNISGATLTARAMTAAVRRVLALHAVIDPFGAMAK